MAAAGDSYDRAGILLLQLAPEMANQVFRSFDQSVLEKITAALGDRTSIAPETRHQVLAAAREWLNARTGGASGNEGPPAGDFELLLDHLNASPADVVALIADWCRLDPDQYDGPDRTSPPLPFASAARLRGLRRELFADDPRDRFYYTYSIEAAAGYAWAIRENELRLRAPDPEGLIAGNRAPVYEIRLAPAESPGLARATEELMMTIAALETNFVPLHPVERRATLGRGQFCLIELPRARSSAAIELLHIESYRPAQYRDALLGFVEKVDREHFVPAHGAVRVQFSILSRLPVAFLERELAPESDRLIAFLRAHLPADNLERFVAGLPPARREKIHALKNEIAGQEFQPALFREVERVLERKFHAQTPAAGGRVEP